MANFVHLYQFQRGMLAFAPELPSALLTSCSFRERTSYCVFIMEPPAPSEESTESKREYIIKSLFLSNSSQAIVYVEKLLHELRAKDAGTK